MHVALALCLTLLWIPLLSAVTPSTQPELRLYTEEYAPFNFSSGESVAGVNTEIIQRTLTILGIRWQVEIVPWGRAQRFTQTQANTCFYSAVRTMERELMYQWVGPLIEERVQLFSLDPNMPIFTQFGDAKHLKIGGQTADAYTDYGASQGLKIDRVAEIPVNLTRLQLGRIDLWLAGSIGGAYIGEQSNLKLYPVASSEQLFQLWLACNPEISPQLIKQLNETLHLLQAQQQKTK